MELCGALLLARLYHEASEAFGIIPDRVVLWCDSTIVLHWIKTPSHALKTYVATRVAEIQELTSACEWRHVRSDDNPADIISRGQLLHTFLRNQTWVTGPSWLVRHEWPNESIQVNKLPELKTNTCLAAMSNDFGIFEKSSSFVRLRRIIAYCFRFRTANRHIEPLFAEKINDAETRILRPRNFQTKSKFLKLSIQHSKIESRV